MRERSHFRSTSLGALVVGALTVACGARDGAPEGTRWLPGGSDHWKGWIELVPAIETPRFEDDRDRTTVYARFTPGSQVTLADPSDRTSLRVPLDAALDRVERFTLRGTSRVADVRGTVFTARGEVFYSWRPYDHSASRIFGVSWARAAEPPPAVRRAMRQAMRDGHGSVLPGVSRPERIERYERLLRCAGCHEPRQPERVGGADAWPRRATDASGLYSLLATLRDSAMVETYRPRDPNRARAFVTYSPPRASLDVTRALAQGDPHARALCASRRALVPFLSSALRCAYNHELRECGIFDGGV